MRPSIDYLNARREFKPASGGKRYEVKRNAVDDRAQFNGLDEFEQIILEFGSKQTSILADFRAEMDFAVMDYSEAKLSPRQSAISLEDTF